MKLNMGSEYKEGKWLIIIIKHIKCSIKHRINKDLNIINYHNNERYIGKFKKNGYKKDKSYNKVTMFTKSS
ncbi:hypothetical protein KPL33_11465 [Clostridium algidicarnis]|uniref:hypothetical protein n=1 Tax=Clostridium algidicarnis TaxID=37659 RepID=UPI001C0BA3F1|nr:hypothetical protein [Clostridium algidicarnis]MBU3207594.1 hypothetical protein [Clostridium algidicarnis]